MTAGAGLDDPLEAEAIGAELDELPLPYRFDVKALPTIRSRPLLEHIERVGIRIHERPAGEPPRR